MRRYAVIDYETYSEADLGDVGAYEYSLHPSSEILCVAWRVGTRQELADSTAEDTGIWAPWLVKKEKPAIDFGLINFLNVLSDESLTLVGHNAFFEQCITRNLLINKYVPDSLKRKTLEVTGTERWYCTAAQVQALSLLRSLDKVGKILDLDVKKDKVGSEILKRWMKPQKVRGKDEWYRHEDPKEFPRLIEYCKTDIASEIEVFVTTPMLSRAEQEVYQFDQMVNFRGFAIDRKMVESACSIIEREKAELQARAFELTGGAVVSIASGPLQIKKWLESIGVFLPSVGADAVREAIDEGLVEGDALEVLEIRQAAAMSSVAKYPATERVSRSDNRCRGCFIYHGAATGRWAGSNVQPHNYKKPPKWMEDPDYWAELIASGDIDTIKMLFGNPIPLLADCVRGTVIAGPGKKLHVADWNAIEARVVFWITGDEKGLDVFRKGGDPYISQAAKIFGVPESMVTRFQREIGKGATLGCGFQMGAPRFSAQYKVSAEIGKTAVDLYRSTHHMVASFWKDVESTAIKAVQSGRRMPCRKVTFYTEGDFLFCELPSGRRIAYHKPEVVWEQNPWGSKSPKLYFWGEAVQPKGNWVRQSTYGGMLTENIVQATARDIMVSAMMRAERAGWKIVLHVHDEIVAELSEHDKRAHFDYCKLLSELPDWAKGCPIKVGGFESKRYRKG